MTDISKVKIRVDHSRDEVSITITGSGERPIVESFKTTIGKAISLSDKLKRACEPTSEVEVVL
jgi:hypothetical protein